MIDIVTVELEVEKLVQAAAAATEVGDILLPVEMPADEDY